jgi:hypothetical protein
MRNFPFSTDDDLVEDGQKYQELIRLNKKLLAMDVIDDFKGRLEISAWRHKQHAILLELLLRFNDSKEMDELITVLDECKICFPKPL